MATILLDDLFTVQKVNPDDYKFDKVSRLVCKASTYDIDMIIDINTEVYPMRDGEVFKAIVADSLNGRVNDGSYMQGDANGDSLLDRFEYAMQGKIFAYEHLPKEEGKNDITNRVSVFASFGGLLLCLKGPQSQLALLEDDKKIFILIKKVV